MKKKFLPWLFLLVALHFPYAASAGNAALTPIDTENCQPEASVSDATSTAINTEVSQPNTSESDSIFTPIDSEISQPATSSGDPAVASIDTEVDQSDTYLSLVENYFSFLYEPLKMDYLYDVNSKNSLKFPSVKKIDWSAFFRNNGAFLYGIRINQSRFALCVGLGWSSLYYSFIGEKHGGDTIYKELKRVSDSDASFQDLPNIPGRKVFCSTLNIPFFDVLLRLRFNSVLEAPKEGFHGWLGLKFGLRQRAAMKYYYEEYNDSGASLVTNGNFNLLPYACVLQAGMGYHRFGFTGGIHLTPLFQKNKGPDGSDSRRLFSLGIYVDLM
ncbi:hypothetical protein ACRRVB_01715 [Candidatus Cardinium hertigii]|uniref:hypothetical protein n=1 Tax=Candidatus Cardinium hertigii TaxID=247481 RepID=UPI003D7CF674